MRRRLRCPRYDRFVHLGGAVTHALFADGQCMRTKDIHFVVKFFVDGRPITKRFCDRMFCIDEIDRYRLLRAVPAGLQSKMLKPRNGTSPEAVHYAVQVDGWDYLLNLHNAIHQRRIFDVGGALVVNDDVLVLGPIQFRIERQDRRRR